MRNVFTLPAPRRFIGAMVLWGALPVWAASLPAQDPTLAADSWCGRSEIRARQSLNHDDRNVQIRHALQLANLARMQGLSDEADQWLTYALDRAETQLDRMNGDSRAPLRSLAAVRYGMGCVHRWNTDFEAAEKEFRDARELAILAFGVTRPDVARSAGAYAASKSPRGDLEQARKLCTWAVTHVTENCGTNDLEVIWIDDTMGRVYAVAGRHDLALPVYQHMLTVAQAALPADHPDRAVPHNRIASIYHELNRPQDAIPHLEKALEIRIRAFGADHAQTALSRKNLTNARRQTAKLNP